MREFYFYSEKQIHKTIKEMFINFKVHTVSEERIKKNNFINQNILLIVGGDILGGIIKSFFYNNNVVILYTTNKLYNNKNILEAKIFNKQININKFIDEVTTSFVRSSFHHEDIKIIGERIINKTTDKEVFLTNLEKDILLLLIDQKQTEKNFLLESILKIKKDTETKTIESHLTRIRNKLFKINSKLKI